MTNNLFYRAFEDRFRGSREVIKRRLKVYLPFCEPLKRFYPDGPVLDIGCGRGEWLELLGEHGFAPFGVDLDDGMLMDCRALGLPARRQDALEALATLPDNSQIVVSGFHIAEHLPFDTLQQVVEEAHRVLRPGGLLILETPNPENFTVGASMFYLDPTHLKPIPSTLLSFLPEYYGFRRLKIVRLQESPDLLRQEGANILDVLAGVSPDYAIIAQKDAVESVLASTSSAFEKEYGVGLIELAERFDRRIHARIERSESEIRQAFERIREAETRSESEIRQAFERIREAENRTAVLVAQLDATYRSTSWRATGPLRAAMTKIRSVVDSGSGGLTSKADSRPRRVARRCLKGIADWIRAEPRRHALAARIRRRMPWPDTTPRAAGAKSRASWTEGRPSHISAKYEVPEMPGAAAKIYEQLHRARHDRLDTGEIE